MSNNPGHFIWYELITSDMDAAAEFYGAAVGWSAQASGQPGQDYRMWTIGGQTVGGMIAIPPAALSDGMKPVWLGYVNVADVDQSVGEIQRAGGSVQMPAWDVPGVGRMAMVCDPQGAAFYVMSPIGEGPSPSFTPGRLGHGGWNELHTTDWKNALEFYGGRLGWGASEAVDMGPMGTYQLFNAGGEAIGGIMNSPAFGRPMWLYYFNVDDIAAAVSRVQGASGAILNGPHQVPTGDG